MVFDDVTQKVVVAVLTAIGVAVVFWVHRTYLKPLASLPQMQLDLAAIKSEVQVNSGKSLKDQVQATRNEVGLLEARQRGLIASLSRATFETDHKFNWIDTNPAMDRLTGVGFSHLERRRWVSMIHDDDRSAVINEIDYAVQDGRRVSISFRWITDDGEIPVRLEASPVYSRVPPTAVMNWFGFLVRQDERRNDDRRLP